MSPKQPGWVRPIPGLAQVSDDGQRLLLRRTRASPWVEAPLLAVVSSLHATRACTFVSWRPPWDEASDADRPMSETDPVVTAYAYDGSALWTLFPRDLPFYGRAGVRAGGAGYVAADGRGALLLRSGPWFCVLEDIDGPSFGPVERT